MRQIFLTIWRRAFRLRVVRFIMAGGVNTAFGYAVYLAGLLAGLQPVVALAASFVVGAIFNYFTTARFVFGHEALNRLPLFIGAYVAVYAVNAACIKVLLASSVPPSIAQVVLIPFMAALSFVLFKTVVFRRPAAADRPSRGDSGLGGL